MSSADKGLPPSGIIRSEDVPAVRRWDAPAVGAAPRGGNSAKAARPAESGAASRELEALRQAAREQGYADGRAEGLRAGRHEAQTQVRAQAERLAALCRSLDAPLSAVDAAVEEQLVHLALTLARQIIRRELHTQPGEIVGVVREALGLLPVASRGVRVRVHPEDAALMRECGALPGDGETWRVEEDPMITRGGCLVVSEDARIDATLEHRLAALASQVLGDERTEPGADDPTELEA